MHIWLAYVGYTAYMNATAIYVDTFYDGLK